MTRLVLGVQPVREVLRAHGGSEVRVLIERRQRGTERPLEKLARFAADQHAQVERVARAQLDRLARGTRHQGVAAYAPELKLHRLDKLDFSSAPAAITVLDGITDPQNFGAVLRSAVALGDGTVVWGEHGAAPLTAATFRASAGAVEHATLCQTQSLKTALHQLSEAGVTTIALDAAAEQALPTLDLTGSVAIVIGAEGPGLARAVRAACDVRAKLPMSGRLDSLNASVATAVALYEIRRQRSSTSS